MFYIHCLHVAIQFSQHHLLKRLPFPQFTLLGPSLQVNWLLTKHSLKLGSTIPPVLLFFLKIVLAIWHILCFNEDFKIICFSSVKNALGILIEIVLNLVDCLGKQGNLNNIILPTHKHNISFYLLMFVFNFYQCLIVFSIQVWCWVVWTPS